MDQNLDVITRQKMKEILRHKHREDSGNSMKQGKEKKSKNKKPNLSVTN